MHNSIANFPLTETAHRAGINVRYFGEVVRVMGTRRNFYDLLLMNMLARIVKNEMRLLLRKEIERIKVCTDEPYRILVTDYLNVVFGNTKESERHWTEEITWRMSAKFNLSKSNWKFFPEDLKKYVFVEESSLFNKKLYLFENVVQMSGLQVSSSVLTPMRENPAFWSQRRPFDDTDFELGERVKQVDIIANASGFLYSRRAREKEGQAFYNSALALYKRASHEYTVALSSSPNDPILLSNFAKVKVKTFKLNEAIANSIQPDKVSTQTYSSFFFVHFSSFQKRFPSKNPIH